RFARGPTPPPPTSPLAPYTTLFRSSSVATSSRPGPITRVTVAARPRSASSRAAPAGSQSPRFSTGSSMRSKPQSLIIGARCCRDSSVSGEVHTQVFTPRGRAAGEVIVVPLRCRERALVRGGELIARPPGGAQHVLLTVHAAPRRELRRQFRCHASG